MKKGSTLFLKGVLVFIGLVTLAICIFALPSMVKGMVAEFPAIAAFKEPMLYGLYLTAVPFFFALFQAFKLLNYIDRNTAFSNDSIHALRAIKYSATAITALYLLGMPVVFLIAESDDAPGVVILGLLWACSPLVIAVFAAVLEKLLRNVIEIKSENDLVV